MKTCNKCQHYRDLTWTLGPNTGRIVQLCMLKSEISDVYYVTGESTYNSTSVVYCNDERRVSTGFFGFFKDETRCGPDAINFKEVE